MSRIRVLILGAAGRDFHNFNVIFRGNPAYEVVGFTATQIPNIAGRKYPSGLAGDLYKEGIPIFDEKDLESLIVRHRVQQVVFSYSDVSHEHVMHLASRAVAKGADFRLLGASTTMIRSARPVVSICAVRTGAGKSPTTRRVAAILRAAGRRVAVIRHPMPYGDLEKQAVQRFKTVDDLRFHDCTIEEMEEYEPHIAVGDVVYAGVDYERIVRRAESEADVILWDGGNNDTPFVVSDLEIVVVDAQRPGHERSYFPGEVNFLRAQVLVISKMDTARPSDVALIQKHIEEWNPKALVVKSAMPVTIDRPELVRGKRVLAIEDGPTITHGGMSFGAGALAAQQAGAAAVVDPRPYAVGALADTFARYPHIGAVLPAMGYGLDQIHDLEETIRRTPCDTVVIGTPVNLARVLKLEKPAVRATYELAESGSPSLSQALAPILNRIPD
jgi:predicted GTPase